MRVALFLLSLACSTEQPAARLESTGAAAPPAGVAATAPTHTPPPDAVAANTQGYRAYEAGDLAAAAQAFRDALALDDDYALAHYNLACTLALLRRQGQICQHGATEPAILDELERAVALDPDRRRRMRLDSDLDDLRDTIRYRLLDGLDATTDAGLQALLTGVELFGPPQGVYGSLTRLRLLQNGRAVHAERQRAADGSLGDWTERAATWSVTDGVVHIDVHIDGGGDIQDLRLSADGTLGTGDAALWFDSPPECAA